MLMLCNGNLSGTYMGMKTKPIMTARQKLEMETTWKLRYIVHQSRKRWPVSVIHTLNSCFFPMRRISAESAAVILPKSESEVPSP
jgi:hypothetical protein